QLGGDGTTELAAAVAAWCRRNPERKLLLIFDQFEELITSGCPPVEHAAFLRSLDAAVQTGGGHFRLVITLRSDYEPHFQDWLSGPDAPRFLVPHMSREDLRAAIEGPAAERVLYFEPADLVDKLVDEVIDMPGGLPLLSFTLSEMYRSYVRTGRTD